jgi:hypothetical protein
MFIKGKYKSADNNLFEKAISQYPPSFEGPQMTEDIGL